jgi:solute carrier family 6 GABA transporter-like protein 6/8/11/12/13
MHGKLFSNILPKLNKNKYISGKVVYVTATFPYIVIIIMLIRGVTLDGASMGLKYFFQPKWSDLLKPKVWANAAIQNFNSIGVAFGGLISMASYKRKTDRILRYCKVFHKAKSCKLL